MKEYYLERLHWIFHYSSKNFFYCLAKTLCLIVGVPIYAVSFVIEMVLTFINMIFSWIPILNVVVMAICKALIWLVSWTFYICILPDIKAYKAAHKKEPDYEVMDEQPGEGADDANGDTVGALPEANPEDNEPTTEGMEPNAEVLTGDENQQ